LHNRPGYRGVFLAFDVQEQEIELFRKHEPTGRPLGADSFVEKWNFF